MARVSTKLPGVVITEALKKLGATVEKLSEATGIPVAKINAVINKGEPVTPELSVKLGRALGERDRHFAELQLTQEIATAVENVGKIRKLRKPAGRPGRKPGAKPDAAAQTTGSKRGRKPGPKPGAKPDVAAQTTGSKRGRKPGPKPAAKPDAAAQTTGNKRGRKPGPKPKE
jgi:addiction module HigA family antidote